MLACPGSLYCRIQGEDIGLEGYLVNGLDNLGDILGGGLNVLHGCHHLRHLFIALLGIVPDLRSYPGSTAGIAGHGANLGIDFRNGGGKLLHRGCLPCRTIRQGVAGVGNVPGAAGHLLGSCGNLSQQVIELCRHIVKGTSHSTYLILAVSLQGHGQITPCYAPGSCLQL